MYSSSSKNSSDSSRVKIRGVLITAVWSFVAERTFVICLALVMLTVKSFSREFSPIIIPSYTSVPGLTKIVPRSSTDMIEYVVALPVSIDTRAPRRRPPISALITGMYWSNVWFMIP